MCLNLLVEILASGKDSSYPGPGKSEEKYGPGLRGARWRRQICRARHDGQRQEAIRIADDTAGRGQFCSPAESPAEVNVDAQHSKYSRIIRIIAYDSAIFRVLCIYIHFCRGSAGHRIVPFQQCDDRKQPKTAIYRSRVRIGSNLNSHGSSAAQLTLQFGARGAGESFMGRGSSMRSYPSLADHWSYLFRIFSLAPLEKQLGNCGQR
jgi:hypothetical protein